MSGKRSDPEQLPALVYGLQLCVEVMSGVVLANVAQQGLQNNTAHSEPLESGSQCAGLGGIARNVEHICASVPTVALSRGGSEL